MTGPLVVLQEGRPLTAVTPLGEDVLVPVRLEGVEELSRPFLFTVDFLSELSTISSKDILGKGVGLTIALPGPDGRALHGIVRRFAKLGTQETLTRYRAEIVPELWLLSLSNAHRSFQQLSATEIVTKVCQDAGISAPTLKITAPPAKRDWVVQYGETHLDFVARLLEEAGLHYYFTYTASAHTFVISDAKGSAIPAASMEKLRVVKERGARAPLNVVVDITREYALHADKLEVYDHDLYRADAKDTETSESDPFGTSRSGTQRAHYAGDLTPDGSAKEQARLRVELEETERDVVRGTSTCPALAAGARTTIEDFDELLLLRVSHVVEIGDVLAASGLGARYENAFVAIPAATQYRPARRTPRARVHGTQVAVVTGLAGEEIYTDAHGRVKLRFPWDGQAKADESSSPWIPVASVWAGAGWGFVQPPRIGQEVLVEFLEGDPERPIVTGRVYTANLAVPYALPDNKTQSGWRSRSTPEGGADNYNEIRFEDKKGSEHVAVQAEKDLQVVVKNDETRDVRHDRTTTVRNDDTRTVSEGNDTHTVSKGNQSVTISEGDQTVTVSKGKQAVEVQQDQTVTIHQGNRSVTLEQGNDKLAVQTGNLTIDVATGNVGIKADAGKITIEAMQQIELKVGESSIVLSQEGVEIKGLKVSSEATTQAEFKGLTVSVEAQTQAELKGMMVSVEGQAMTQVKAALTQVNADAMLMLKGGITMVN